MLGDFACSGRLLYVRGYHEHIDPSMAHFGHVAVQILDDPGIPEVPDASER
jgi:hypothetical protein